MNAQGSARTRRQGGGFSVEFALIVVIFLTVVMGVVEVARAIYLINTLQEVTRRAAAGAAATSFSDAAAMNTVRQRAVFRDDAGLLMLGTPVTDAHVRIDYLWLQENGGTLTMVPITGGLPSCPARNRLNCLTSPNASSCVRFVRAQICEPGSGGTCTPVQYRTVTSLVALPFNLPRATTIVKAESLGYVPGSPPCPP